MKSFFRHIVLYFILLPEVSLAQKTTSELSTGSWYKIAILEEGIYKIDANFLDQIGMDRSGLDPDNIAVYGNSYNGMLPQANSEVRPDDLIENHILAVGLSDGSFGSDDYILFYGKSSDHISYDDDINEFIFEKNLYSDTSFYFITIKENAGIRMSQDNNETTSNSYVSSFTRFIPHEWDNYNLLKTESTLLGSGRNWYGEKMDQTRSETTITFENLSVIQNSEIKIYTSVLSKAQVNSAFEISLNGVPLQTINMVPVSTSPWRNIADIKTATLTLNSNQIASTSTLNIEYKFVLEEGVTNGHVDYAHLVVESPLNLTNEQIGFYKTTDHSGYQISGATATTKVLDISNPVEPKVQNIIIDGNTAMFRPNNGSTQFVSYNDGQEQIPIFIESIQNQNLHGLGSAEAIYITHQNFRTEVERLANFRLANDGILTEVVTVDEIYNEYSSGRQDISAIRDFIRHQYIKSGQMLKYVTMVGDCSYDYKDRSIEDTNFVPVYQTRNSIHEIESFSSEDFYGFMEEDEGQWEENSAGNHTIDVGIGRIPVRTAEEMNDYVNKVMRYEKSTSGYGKWRNQFTFIADDGDNNTHQTHADAMSEYVEGTQNVFNVRKIYLDAYEQIGPGEQTSPSASKAFVEAISNGNLIVNYTGHGNLYKLTDEDIFNEDLIETLSNRIHLPFFIAATCEFGNYDNPVRISGGEKMLLHPQGGSIGLLCSTRPVYASSNFIFNLAFYEAAMSKVDGKYQRLGDLYRITKNNSLDGIRNRNYALLGDASMSLSFPDQEVVLDSINGKPIHNLDSLNALGSYVLDGSILSNGNIDEKFNGSVFVSVFDKHSSFITKGDEVDSTPEEYEVQDVLIFQGESSVINGRFTSEFIVPKNIDYSFSEGKIAFYAVNSNHNIDAHGAFSEIIVGGSSENYIADNTPPNIHLFLNNTNFRSGQTVNSNSILIAQLSDESGINIAKSDFGQDLRMYLDDNEPIVLNDYYTASLDTYEDGLLTYPLDNIEIGSHTLTLEAYDIHNNRTTEEINFTVSGENGILISGLSNYPNPMIDKTTFTFSHDRPGEELNIALSIRNLQGQEILRNEYRFVDSPVEIDNIEWNGQDTWGNRLRKGIYIYKIIVQSEVDGASSEHYRKLIILN
ncbi:MAG: type IX secretion system sortase PorU [Reichenbachiella sp.]